MAENIGIIASCGLYCSNCNKFKNGKCLGCAKNEKASWCAIRKCTIEKGIANCAFCNEFADTKQCRKVNNFVGKIFSLIFGSNRPASLAYIRANGAEAYTKLMLDTKQMCIKRGQKI